MEKSGFFNSSGGDRIYNATDFASYFGRLVSNGIFYDTTANLQASGVAGMVVTIQPGASWINGYCYENTAPLELTVPTASGINPRIDRVVVRWSAVERLIRLAIIIGTASASPVAPSLTRNNDVCLCLRMPQRSVCRFPQN